MILSASFEVPYIRVKMKTFCITSTVPYIVAYADSYGTVLGTIEDPTKY